MAGSPMDSRITGIEHDAHEIKEAVRRMATNHSGNQIVQPVTIQAGGIGVWIAATCCFVMLGLIVLGALWMSRELTRIDQRAAEQEVKIDRANTFLSAIWANAPELEKKVKSEQEKDRAQR